MFKFMNIFAILGVAMGSSQKAPWDVEDPHAPLCPMKMMNGETKKAFKLVWDLVERSRAGDDLEIFIPSFRKSVRSLCNRLPSESSINEPEFKVFLIAYLLIDGFVLGSSVAELAENLGVEDRLSHYILRIAVVINSMQSDPSFFSEGQFLHREPESIYSHDVEEALSKLDDKDTASFVNGIILIAGLSREAYEHQSGELMGNKREFPGLARDDLRSLIALAKPGSIDAVVRMILNFRAIVLYYEDRVGHTQLKKFSSEGFKIWYKAIKSTNNLRKREKIWEVRSMYNWAQYKKSLKKKGESLHPFEQDVGLLGPERYCAWTKRFTNVRFSRV